MLLMSKAIIVPPHCLSYSFLIFQAIKSVHGYHILLINLISIALLLFYRVIIDSPNLLIKFLIV